LSNFINKLLFSIRSHCCLKENEWEEKKLHWTDKWSLCLGSLMNSIGQFVFLPRYRTNDSFSLVTSELVSTFRCEHIHVIVINTKKTNTCFFITYWRIFDRRKKNYADEIVISCSIIFVIRQRVVFKAKISMRHHIEMTFLKTQLYLYFLSCWLRSVIQFCSLLILMTEWSVNVENYIVIIVDPNFFIGENLIHFYLFSFIYNQW